jgi:hypothetical protein
MESFPSLLGTILFVRHKTIPEMERAGGMAPGPREALSMAYRCTALLGTDSALSPPEIFTTYILQ